MNCGWCSIPTKGGGCPKAVGEGYCHVGEMSGLKTGLETGGLMVTCGGISTEIGGGGTA